MTVGELLLRCNLIKEQLAKHKNELELEFVVIIDLISKAANTQ